MSPVDWDSPTWGNNVHVAADCPDAHDRSEQAAEERQE